MSKPTGPAWKLVRRQDTERGTVEMWCGEFGKGRAKIRSWKFYLGDTQIDYASTTQDAEENWLRCVHQRGRQEAAV